MADEQDDDRGRGLPPMGRSRPSRASSSGPWWDQPKSEQKDRQAEPDTQADPDSQRKATGAVRDAAGQAAKKSARTAGKTGAKTASAAAGKQAASTAGKTAGKTVARKASGVGEIGAAAKALTRKGEKKTAGKEAKDAGLEVTAGAAQGAAVGGLAGAGIGALKGAGMAAIKSARGRKLLIALAVIPFLPLIAAFTATAVVGGMMGMYVGQVNEQSYTQSMDDIDDADTSESVMLADIAEDTPVAWQLLLAIMYVDGNASKPGPSADGDDVESPEDMDCPEQDSAVEDGLTTDALLVYRCGAEKFPELTSWGGVGDRGNNPNSDHPAGRAIDAMIPEWATSSGNDLGWQVAQWYKSNAEELGIKYVLFDEKQWTGGDSWDDYEHPAGPTDNETLLHRDHVHISVVDEGEEPADSDEDTTHAGGQGRGPFGLTDEADLDDDDADDPQESARYVTAELADRLRAQNNASNSGISLDTGVYTDSMGRVSVAISDEDEDLNSDNGDLDEVVNEHDAVHAANVREAYIDVLTDGLFEDMDDDRAEAVFLAARNWYVGESVDLSQDSHLCEGGDDAEAGGVDIPDEYVDDIADAADTSGVPASVLAAQIQAESNWDPKAESEAGARGIAQFMPGTWSEYGHGEDPFDPHAGIQAQGEYMRDLMDDVDEIADDDTDRVRFALAAYNAGLGPVLTNKGIPDFDETKNYVKQIMADADTGEISCSPDGPGDIELGPGEWAPVLPGGHVTSDYGERPCPFSSCAGREFLTYHDGIDLAGGEDHFYAPTDMKITHVGGPGDRMYQYYGNYIFAEQVDSPNLVFEFHEAADGSVLVSEGDTVDAGEPLAEQGATGNSTGVHVHFQIDEPGTDVSGPGSHSGETLDPIPILKEKGVEP